MTKIVLDEVGSGYNLTKINTNFQRIEDALNNQVLYRDNVPGEPNALQDDIDANGKRIYNLPLPISNFEPVRFIDVVEGGGRALRVPAGESVDEIPNVEARKGMLLSFDPSTGMPEVVAPITDSSTALRLDLANSVDVLKGAGLVGFAYDRAYAQGTIGAMLRGKYIDMTQKPYNCDKTGVSDCSAACAQAWADFPGIAQYYPAGTYRFNSTVLFATATTWGVFSPGPKIIGDGIGKTFFDTRVSNGPLFDVDSITHGGPYSASLGSLFEGFNIITNTTPTLSIGIRGLNAYQMIIRHVVIKGMTAYGIHLQNGAYDDDGWNMVHFHNVWLEDNKIWGIKADGATAPVGRNEGSYTFLNQVFFQTNGGTVTSSNPPTSGGMIWKGQVLVIENSGWANGTANCGLYIKGGPGLGNTVDLRNITFENTFGWGLFCDGVDLLKGRNIQFYNNTVYTCDTMCEFDASANIIRNVDIDGVIVRNAGLNMTGSIAGTVMTISAVAAGKLVVGSRVWGAGIATGTVVTSLGTGTGGIGTYNVSPSQTVTGPVNIKGRSTTAFKISGNNAEYDSCRVRNVSWENHEFPDQARFNGWHFDGIVNQCELAVGSPGSLLLRPKTGKKVPYRLRGSIGGVPTQTGEWVEHEIPSGGIGIAAPGGGAVVYYVYLYDNSGAPALELSTTGPSTDPVSGYQVKGTDYARYFLGRVATDGSGQFLTSGTGWLNPTPISSGQIGTSAWMWYSNTPAGLRYTNVTMPTSDGDGSAV